MALDGMGALSMFAPQIKRYFRKKIEKKTGFKDVEVTHIELKMSFPDDSKEDSDSEISDIRIYTNHGNFKMPTL